MAVKQFPGAHMSSKASKTEPPPGGVRIVRLIPTQQRSRERFERILDCAIEVMTEKGSDAFKMSDLVERTGIPFGSLYQYFPDKTSVIGTLAERYNALGRDCVSKSLSRLTSVAHVHDVLCDITDSYYQFFIDEPAVRQIWQATQADHALQALDEDEGNVLTNLLFEAMRPHTPGVADASLAAFCQLMMILIAAAVRHAIVPPPGEGREILALFKRTLPKDLTALGA
jgi:AcrR family transcriptional regulator